MYTCTCTCAWLPASDWVHTRLHGAQICIVLRTGSWTRNVISTWGAPAHSKRPPTALAVATVLREGWSVCMHEDMRIYERYRMYASKRECFMRLHVALGGFSWRRDGGECPVRVVSALAPRTSTHVHMLSLASWAVTLVMP